MPGECGADRNKIDKAFGKPSISIILEHPEIGDCEDCASKGLIKGSKDKSQQ